MRISKKYDICFCPPASWKERIAPTGVDPWRGRSLVGEVQDENALEMEEAIAVKRAVSKSSRLYNNKKWDLVDAYADEEFEISTVEKDQLPNELKNKNEKEIKDYIESKKAERIQIQKEIQEYNSKRLAYIAEHQNADKSGELENAMIKAIKKQAESKNYSWE